MKLFMRIAWFLVAVIVIVIVIGIVAALGLVGNYLKDRGWGDFMILVVSVPTICFAAWLISAEWIKSAERNKAQK